MALRNRRAVLGAIAATALAGVTGAIPVRSQPAERVVKLNEPVILQFTTSDVVMGFNAPDFGARATIIPGQTARVRIVPNKVGTFTFHCDVFCGDGHEDMDGTIRVTA